MFNFVNMGDYCVSGLAKVISRMIWRRRGRCAQKESFLMRWKWTGTRWADALRRRPPASRSDPSLPYVMKMDDFRFRTAWGGLPFLQLSMWCVRFRMCTRENISHAVFIGGMALFAVSVKLNFSCSNSFCPVQCHVKS
jgi:hypothetical protein